MTSVPSLLLAVLAAYLLGNISPGLILARLAGKGDVREQGSGATGATNAARALGGRGWFLLVLALDILKGGLGAAGVPALLDTLPWLHLDVAAPGTAPDGIPRAGITLLVCGAAVVAGHIWPALLGFRGGKGIGPFIGVWLFIQPLSLSLLAPIATGVIPLLALRTRPFICALLMLWTQPVAATVITGGNLWVLAFGELIVAFLLVAHRENLRAALARR